MLSHHRASFTPIIIQINESPSFVFTAPAALSMMFTEMYCYFKWGSLWGGDLFISLGLQDMNLWSARSAFQDKLLEEMWKQQDSLEAPAATAAETPASPEAGGGPEENIKDGNPLLERLRALEVRLSPSMSFPFISEMYDWSIESTMFYSISRILLGRRRLKDSTRGPSTIVLFTWHLITAGFCFLFWKDYRQAAICSPDADQ